MPLSTVPYLALVPYAAVAAGLLITLALFLSVKAELLRTARQEHRRYTDLLARLETAAQPPEAVYVPVAVPPGVNLNRRIRVLRMLRKGEDAAHIAAALGIPRKEVDLLVRVTALNTPHSGPQPAAAD